MSSSSGSRCNNVIIQGYGKKDIHILDGDNPQQGSGDSEQRGSKENGGRTSGPPTDGTTSEQEDLDLSTGSQGWTDEDDIYCLSGTSGQTEIYLLQ